ncbi:MAG: NAD(P)-dependent alcohol dehydrogenase [Hyphomicrobiaceae bacterium]
MRAWQIVSDGGIEALQLNETRARAPGVGEVAVRMHANSINYRDFLTVTDPVSRKLPYPRVPNSDGAGEVIAVGPGVSEVKVGDRVASCFFQRWTDGSCSAEAMASALGGAVDGVLAEEAILRADGVVPMPKHLSFAEAATLPCAGLTAWNAIVKTGQTKAGDWVLLLGTGGVSIFALQFAHMMGARTIVTSSSDDKLETARSLGATVTVNYRRHPSWEEAVLEATQGRGVDLAVEVTGAKNLPKTINATRIAGRIALIGAMHGGAIDPAQFMRRSIRIQGIYVGSRRMFLDMIRAVEAQNLKPVIDTSFRFEQAREAYRHMEGQGHLGKIVIEMS